MRNFMDIHYSDSWITVDDIIQHRPIYIIQRHHYYYCCQDLVIVIVRSRSPIILLLFNTSITSYALHSKHERYCCPVYHAFRIDWTLHSTHRTRRSPVMQNMSRIRHIIAQNIHFASSIHRKTSSSVHDEHHVKDGSVCSVGRGW